jgi:hypothetical protein
MSSLCEVVEKQDQIIRIQSGVINDLLTLLMQHITVEEADSLPLVEKINLAADIRASLE